MPPRNPRSHNRFPIAVCQNLQEVAMSRHTWNRSRVQHNSAANRHHRRKLPDDKPVSRQKQRPFRQLQPRKRLFAGKKLRGPIFAFFAEACHELAAGVGSDSFRWCSTTSATVSIVYE